MVQQPVSFGKYMLLERISVGGMAEVFKAKYSGVEGFQKILAIKRILPSLTDDAEFIRMFIDEAKIAGQLNHANICQIYELGKINQHHFIAMEYIWGKDLLQISNRYKKMRQTMPFSQACYILGKACEALDYAHKKKDAHGRPMGIIHRDVTPQNILISYEGEVKLIDFGIAKARDRSAKTKAGVLKGKFGYMSPEQVRGLPLDQRSDIFSMGILLYETTTGMRLFDGETDFVVLEKVRNGDVPRPSSVNPQIPRKLESILMRALQQDPDDRYQTAGELHQALQSFMMTQRPVYSAKLMSQWMSKTFAADIRRERVSLERWFKGDESSERPSATSPRRRQPTIQHKAAAPPPRPRAAAPPPVPADDDDSDATIIDDEGRMAPLQPIYEEPKQGTPKPAAAPPSMPHPQKEAAVEVEEPLGDQSTVMLEEGENPMAALQEQATQMLDEDDPDRPDMQAVLDKIASSKEEGVPATPANASPAPATPSAESSSVPPQTGSPSPASNEPTSTPIAGGFTPSGEVAASHPGLQPAVDHKALGAPTQPKKRTILRDLAIALPVAAAFFALGAFAMKLRGSEKAAPAVQQGTIVIGIRPDSKAKISLNNNKSLEVTGTDMAVFDDINQGSHVVKVEAEGYKAKEFQLSVDKGGVTTKTVTLEKLRQPSVLTLNIDPKEAKAIVRIGNEKIPSDALGEPIPLPFDKKVKVEVFAFGYKSFEKTISKTADENIPLDVKLKKAKQPMIQIDSEPEGAAVFLDGEEKCKTLCRLTDLPLKKPFTLSVKKDGFLPQKWKMSFKKGDVGKDLLAALKPVEKADADPSGEEEEPALAEKTEETQEDDTKNTQTKPKTRDRKKPTTRHRHKTKPKTRDQPRPRPPRQQAPKGDCDSRCPSKTKGCLWVNSQPRARVHIGGKDTGRNTPIFGNRALQLKPGYHRVTFVTSDGKKHKFGVQIKACKVSRLVRRLK